MKKSHDMRGKGNRLFLAVSTVLVLFIAACITLTVQGDEKHGAGGYDEAYFDTLEEAYQEEIEMILEEYGVGKSGINLTKMTSGDGTREYTLSIYNRRFERMDDSKLSSLEHALGSVTFPEETFGVVIRLQGI